MYDMDKEFSHFTEAGKEFAKEQLEGTQYRLKCATDIYRQLVEQGAPPVETPYEAIRMLGDFSVAAEVLAEMVQKNPGMDSYDGQIVDLIKDKPKEKRIVSMMDFVLAPGLVFDPLIPFTQEEMFQAFLENHLIEFLKIASDIKQRFDPILGPIYLKDFDGKVGEA